MICMVSEVVASFSNINKWMGGPAQHRTCPIYFVYASTTRFDVQTHKVL